MSMHEIDRLGGTADWIDVDFIEQEQYLNKLLKSLLSIIVLRERAADRSEQVPTLALP